MMKTMMNKLVLSLRAERSDVEIHKHSAFQIVFTEDNPFQTTLENKIYPDIFGFVIKPQVSHSCKCDNSSLIIHNFEPYSLLGKLIAAKLGNSNTLIFNDKESFQTFSNDLENRFSFSNKNQDFNGIDKRVQQSIEYINKNFKSGNVSSQHIAKQVFLSPSRLSALFKDQIGCSISKYLLWTRLRYAIFLILTDDDNTLTSIALESGFYDSSQMTKYMYQMFGISPSKLKQKSELIQFLNLESYLFLHP